MTHRYYCTDCESSFDEMRGDRCGCGSGRVIEKFALEVRQTYGCPGCNAMPQVGEEHAPECAYAPDQTETRRIACDCVTCIDRWCVTTHTRAVA